MMKMTSEAIFRDYDIRSLIPIELLRGANLDFYAWLFRKHGSLDVVDRVQPIRVDYPFVADGNQRVMFKLLNGFDTVRAARVSTGDRKGFRDISEKLRDKGVGTFSELVRVIPFKERYILIQR